MAEAIRRDAPPDTASAEAFERYLVPTVFGPWARVLLDHLHLAAGERLLDVACGTGTAARQAVEIVGPAGSVAALDIDAGMVAHGRTLVEAGAIDWRVGDAQALPWAASVFDAVVCNQGLQFFADRAVALSEMRRVLKPGGRLALAVYCALPFCPAHFAVTRALEKRGIDPAGMQRPCSFGDPVSLGDAVQAAGFRELAVVRRQMEGIFPSPQAFVESLAAARPPARRALERLSPEALRDVIAEVGERLAEFVDDRGFRVVTTANVAVARR